MQEATRILDRVKVMRVFDLAGVAEAIGEVGEIIEVTKSSTEQEDARRGRRTEIGDSEDEADEHELGEIKTPSQKEVNSAAGMVIIDTITNVASAMISKNQIQGQALLASLMRSLSHLTALNRLCTILINAAVGINPLKPPEYRRHLEDNVSIFSSTMGKPALGKTFTYLIDLSIFLTSVPKTTADAVAAYGDKSRADTWTNAVVMEVLKDRRGGREGRWAGYEIVSNVKLLPC